MAEVASISFVAPGSGGVAACWRETLQGRIYALATEWSRQMAIEAIDGVLVVAQLKQKVPGGAVFKEVTIRRKDGDIRRLGTMLVTADMRHAMSPGRSGRFYVYNMLGTKGVHGFRPEGGAARAAFPLRWECMMYGMAVVNALLAWSFLTTGSIFGFLSIPIGIMCAAFGPFCTYTRVMAMKAFREDNEEGAADQPRSAPATSL